MGHRTAGWLQGFLNSVVSNEHMTGLLECGRYVSSRTRGRQMMVHAWRLQGLHEKLQFLKIHRRRRHGGAGVQELARDPEGGTVNKLCCGAPEGRLERCAEVEQDERKSVEPS